MSVSPALHHHPMLFAPIAITSVSSPDDAMRAIAQQCSGCSCSRAVMRFGYAMRRVVVQGG